ncbi:cell division protein FtsQ/DivIB [Arthrobacter alpinus]|uniref:cell division protein FtsQ/DivIB n=1 Tax=Arthrobacter alpinus TaxID=656366 RepID=UPI001648986D|nr:cell division protein FtsQ/DivIB [Arthrobacter alpinus]
MVEPRRPRIIRSRPGATPASGAAVPAPTNPARTGTVRSTSGKVTLTPLAGESPAFGDGSEPGPALVPEATTPEDLDATSSPGTQVPGSAAATKRVSGKVSVSAIGENAESPSNSSPAGGKPATRAKSTAPVHKSRFKAPFSRGKPDQDSPGGARDGAPGAPDGGARKPVEEPGARILAFPVPLHKRRRKRVLLTAAGLATVLALVMAVLLFSPALAVKTITFDGQKLVADATLQAVVAPLINKPLPQVTQGEVTAMLAEVPQIKSSSIEARPPSTLLIHVVERIPVALLKSGDEFILVDQDGVKLGATTDPASVSVPLIDGGTAVIGKDTFVAITAVLATLPQSVLSMLASASATSPDAVELQLADGRVVVWGNASDMELKAQVLDALLTAPAPTAAPGKPEPAPVKVYDVSAPRHPVTR